MTQKSGKEWKVKKGHHYDKKARKGTQVKKEGEMINMGKEGK
jgi:hypothetical protein